MEEQNIRVKSGDESGVVESMSKDGWHSAGKSDFKDDGSFLLKFERDQNRGRTQLNG